MKNVKADQNFELTEFQYDEKNSKAPVMDMDNLKSAISEADKQKLIKDHPEFADIMEIMENPAEMQKEMMNFPPEKTFKTFFNNSLDGITDLKGSGVSLIGYEVYIYFRSEKEPVIKDKEKYVSKNPQETRNWFQKAFPEMAEDLQNIEELICFDYEGRQDRRTLMINRTKKIYFFHAWGGGMD